MLPLLSRREHGCERQDGGNGLHQQDATADGGRTVDPGDRDADEEERLHLPAERVVGNQPPHQAGDEEAVVEPLVPRHRARLGGELLRGAEGGPGARRLPEHHLEHHDVHVDQRDDGGEDLPEGVHVVIVGGRAAQPAPSSCPASSCPASSSPVTPSTSSRATSRCPACRAYSCSTWKSTAAS